MTQFYNFLLQERMGEVKSQYCTPKQELHEFVKARNKPKSTSSRYPVSNDDEVWTETVQHDGKEYRICAHPHSRNKVLLFFFKSYFVRSNLLFSYKR